MLIDTHCHFDLLALETGETVDAIISTMRSAGIANAVQVSIDPAGFIPSWELARRFPDTLRFTLGIHPSTEADEESLRQFEKTVAEVMEQGEKNLLFGIGECGLDYYRLRRPREEQHHSFRRQIALANKYGLPLVIHSREAFEDTIAILKEEKAGRGVFHCFPGNAAEARQALDLGFYCSFAGNVTYPKATPLHESAAYVPADRILLETDAPYLAPVPKRGTTNRPEFVTHTGEFVANLRSMPPEDLSLQVAENYAAFTKN